MSGPGGFLASAHVSRFPVRSNDWPLRRSVAGRGDGRGGGHSPKAKAVFN